MNNVEELEKKPIGKLLIQYSVPTVLSLLVNSLYIVVDRIFIGHIPEVGALALTGIGLTMPIITVIWGVASLISMGASSDISIKLGEGNKKEAENTAGNAITLSVIAGIAITILYLVFQNHILDWLGIRGQTLFYAKEFITIIMLGTVFNMLSIGLPLLVRSDGNPTFSALISITGCILNIALDAIFLQVMHMGIRGAASATAIAQFVTVALGFFYFTRKKSFLRLTALNFKIYPTKIKNMLLIGFVPFSNQLAMSIAQIVSNYSLNLYGGELAVGAMTVITSIAAVFMMPIYGIAQGCQPIIGFNYAKTRYDRTLKTFKLATIGSFAILTTGTLSTLAFPELIVRLFTYDPVLVNIAVDGINKYMILLPLASIPTLGSSFMMMTGRPKAAGLLNISRQSVILGLTIFLLPRVIGLNGLWFAQPITDLLSSGITLFLFIKGYSHIIRKKPSFM
ncbi:MAG TPA: MATE family efflux transporter [Firmicutes bacterium]|nr:MATE family efflux transporter [Bacillota bacterium]